MSKTQAEIRNENINNELFVITEEMKEHMENARIKQLKELPSIIENNLTNKNNFRYYDQSQSFFVVITKDKFLEAEHPAAIIDAIVERLDISRLYEEYSEEGNPAYHPKMMLKILFYAYYISTMSCRLIWDAVINRSDFIYLAAGQVPNFRTINNFRLRHLSALPDLFTQIVVMCKELGLIGFEHLAVDGEKIEANASYRKSKNLKSLEKEYEKIKDGMEKLVNKEVNEYFTEEKKEKRKNTLEKKLDKLDALKEKLIELGDEKKRINMTDEEANVMTHKDGQKLPSYNHQSARDGKFGVVTAVNTTQEVDIPEDLLNLVDQSITNTDENHKNVSADSAFCDYEVLEEIEEREEDFFVPDRRMGAGEKGETKKGKYTVEKFEKDETGDYICPAGEKMELKGVIEQEDGHKTEVYEGTECEGCKLKEKCTKGKKRKINIDSRTPLRDKMREKLKSERGREIYMQRQGIIEPVHGDDQKNRKWIQHHLRGFFKAAMEFLLIRITTNIQIMIKNRGKEIISWA